MQPLKAHVRNGRIVLDVLRALNEQHRGFRLSVMRLVSRALPEQIVAGASALLNRGEISAHRAGILKAMGEDGLGRDDILALIRSADEFEQMYGTIALARGGPGYAADREQLILRLNPDAQEFLRSNSMSR